MCIRDSTENQAEAILNMRLKNLRRLEEMEIKAEHARLEKEQKELKALLKSDEAQWTRIADELKEVRKAFDPKTALGRRRTDFAEAPAAEEFGMESFIEKEPVTIILSEKGWIRTMKGRVEDASEIKYKEGDGEGYVIPAMSTDRLMLFATDGKFYALDAATLPGGRGHGEPIRLLIDLPNDQSVAAAFLYEGGRRLILAASSGHGFFIPEDECVATTRKGKQALNLAPGAEAVVCRPAKGDMVAVVGDNRKLLVFPAAELPEMTRGKGVLLQKCSEGGLSDAKTFAAADGLTWTDRAGRTQTIEVWRDHLGRRGQAGRTAPKGFPTSRKFGRD
jgi:topoisomerase-4 subunit A